ncbi:hypothetical protein Vretimale_17229 [Volvox reticuliferus]|uniref:Uncharacterized protein n=1 Tax=Volvox reticuliferus TaxID=1737510 RepID=A0A8J4GUK3_9CHLO|nr:hypothetical protein Vretimale_17229 [Volvox reticuliferus]
MNNMWQLSLTLNGTTSEMRQNHQDDIVSGTQPPRHSLRLLHARQRMPYNVGPRIPDPPQNPISSTLLHNNGPHRDLLSTFPKNKTTQLPTLAKPLSIAKLMPSSSG